MRGVSQYGKPALAAIACVAGLAVASLADAQTATANSAAYNAGYGRVADQENQPVNPVVRDAQGNLVTVDGVIEGGQDLSGFASGGATGAFDAAAGVGAAGSQTIFGGGVLAVVAPAATANTAATASINNQSNSDDVSATSTLNGGVNNAQ